MLLKEIFYHFRSNKIITTLLICQATLFFILLGTFIAFTSEIRYGKENLEEIYDNKSIYHLLDGYYDPDEFSSFCSQADSLDIIKDYYAGLNSAKSFQYLAMFNQPIDIDNSKMNNPISNTDGEASTTKLNSFQMNLQAHDYFRLSVSDGRTFSSADFEDNGNTIPLLVGSKYADSFSVGDCIPVIYYQKEITLKVVGILEENSIVYFNGDPEFYLDDYFVLPYIDYDPPESEFEEWFQKIVYFAMINGYISTENNDTSSNNMMTEVEAISQKTGFYNYSFIGSNPNFQPYRGLINVINSNYRLVGIFFVLSFLLNAATISLILYFEQKKRLPALAIHYLNGASIPGLAKEIVCESACIMILAFVLCQMVLSYILKINDMLSGIFLFVTAIVLILIVSILPIYKLINTQLTELLNNEEEHL